MTMLDKFLSFAKALPADRLESMEESLAALMKSYSAEYGFTASELAEIDRRVAEDRPQYAAPEAIEKLFGKTFSE